MCFLSSLCFYADRIFTDLLTCAARCTIDTCMEQWSMCNVVTVAVAACARFGPLLTAHCSLHCEVSTLWHSSASDPSTPGTWPPIGGQCCGHVTNHRSASLAALHLGNIYLASIHCKKCCKPTVCQTAEHWRQFKMIFIPIPFQVTKLDCVVKMQKQILSLDPWFMGCS